MSYNTIIFTDVHLYHPHTDATITASSLIKSLEASPTKLRNTDIITCLGDITDKAIPMNSPQSSTYINLILRIAVLCSKYNIIFRILEGTHSHDFGQAHIFDTMFTEAGLNVNFKYINKIEIEYFESLNINVLYVPDDIGSAEENLVTIKNLLKVKSLDRVDTAFMHGQFDYQLPVTTPETYIEEDVLSLVRDFIFIGHIHKHSKYRRIIAPGSFDRLTFGEEEDKGYITASVNDNSLLDRLSYEFIVNKNAAKYNTYDTEDITDVIRILEKSVKSENIRFITDVDKSLIAEYIKKGQYVKLMKRKNVEEVGTEVLELEKIAHKVLTPTNIEDLLREKMDLSLEEMAIFNTEVKL